MQKYVIIYAFVYGEGFVAVKKNKPSWQSGRYNLPGGKVEDGETYRDAALRELKEETNLEPGEGSNVLFNGFISGECYKIAIFTTLLSSFDNLKQLTDEEVIILNRKDLCKNETYTIYNLKLIIPLINEYDGLFVVNGDSYEFQEVRFYD